MKNYADAGGCYPPKPKADTDNILRDMHNSPYHKKPNTIIFYCSFKTLRALKSRSAFKWVLILAKNFRKTVANSCAVAGCRIFLP